jgi:hypothetical protein
MAMAIKLVTCPETAHLEEIEYVSSPLGMLIVRCSRDCPVTCTRLCAARFDARARRQSGPLVIEYDVDLEVA